MEQFESLIAYASHNWQEGSNQCPHRYIDDIGEAQCNRDDNTNGADFIDGIGWCDPDGCPFFKES